MLTYVADDDLEEPMFRRKPAQPAQTPLQRGILNGSFQPRSKAVPPRGPYRKTTTASLPPRKVAFPANEPAKVATTNGRSISNRIPHITSDTMASRAKTAPKVQRPVPPTSPPTSVRPPGAIMPAKQDENAKFDDPILLDLGHDFGGPDLVFDVDFDEVMDKS